jgi:hypothetical protein
MEEKKKRRKRKKKFVVEIEQVLAHRRPVAEMSASLN